ncbi:MAG: P-loop NTPase [Myxococcales bacterium]|nr:P-loop NTPase [Myxococcales bacterium]
MRNLLDRHILLVTGKGGVGKSTVALTLARRAARDGKKVLLIEFESVSRAGPLFGLDQAPAEATTVEPGLDLMGFDLLYSLHFFAVDQLKLKALVKMALRNDSVRGFFLAMPAIKSILFLYHLYRLEAAHGTEGDGRWDLIVCDMPTSGFVAGLYGVPAMVGQIFRIGPLAKTAEGMGKLLFDPLKTGVVLVTLPEEMPVVETIELRNALRQKHGIDTAAIVVNGVYPTLIESAEMTALSEAVGTGEAGDDNGVDGMLWAAQVLRGRSERAAQLLPQLRRAAGGRLIELPHLFKRHLPLSAIDELADVVDQSTRKR